MSLCTYETRNISLADMLVRALPLVSPTSETLIAARLGSCPEEQASRFVVGSLERPGPAARAPEGCHISRRAAAAAWPVHPKGRPSARRRQLGRPLGALTPLWFSARPPCLLDGKMYNGVGVWVDPRGGSRGGSVYSDPPLGALTPLCMRTRPPALPYGSRGGSGWIHEGG